MAAVAATGWVEFAELVVFFSIIVKEVCPTAELYCGIVYPVDIDTDIGQSSSLDKVKFKNYDFDGSLM